MKASTFFRAYLWAEVLFMGYLVLKPRRSAGQAPEPLDDMLAPLNSGADRVKETIDHATQDP